MGDSPAVQRFPNKYGKDNTRVIYATAAESVDQPDAAMVWR